MADGRSFACVLLVACACSSTAGPDGETEARIGITVRRGAETSVTLAVDSVSLVLEPIDGSAPSGVTTGARFPAGADSVRLQVAVPVAQDVASLVFTVQLLADHQPVFETRSRGSVRRGADTEVPRVEPATWERVQVNAGPGPRQSAVLVRAPALGGTVLFGGSTQAGGDESVWVFDGTVWSAAQPAGPSPGSRSGHAMASDATRSEIVLFGGRVDNIAPLSDTWILSSAGWVEAQPADGPSPRTGHAMAYDHRRREVVLFGGRLGLQGSVGDTWIWDGASWRLVEAVGGPEPRSGHTLVWSPARQRVILVGGRGQDSLLADVWEWDGVRWQSRELQGVIPARRGHAAAWDGGRHRLIVHSGVDAASAPLDDMWELVDNRWMLVSHAVRPDLRFGPAMVETGADGVLLFGGRSSEVLLDDLWIYR